MLTVYYTYHNILTFHLPGLFIRQSRRPHQGCGPSRSSFSLGVLKRFPPLSLGLVRALEEVALLVSPLSSLLAEFPHLSSLNVSLNSQLLANSLRVLPELILTSEDPHHAVLKDPLLLFCHRPHAESVDNARMVDIVLEVLNGVDFMLLFELELLRVHARVETGAGVLAVEHEHLLEALLVLDIVSPDKA